jgi:hypothetical protein
MGPGARHLALDDSWGWWNWRKIMGMGAINKPLSFLLLTQLKGDLFRRNLLKALAMKEKHAAINAKFDGIISENLRDEWAKMISQWEHDQTKPNPYTYVEKGNFPFPRL